MKAEELNKLMEAYNSMYAPKEEVVESEQLEEGMGLVTGTAKAINTVLKPAGQTPEQGKEAVRRLTRTIDKVAKPVKDTIKAGSRALLGDKPITAGGGAPEESGQVDRYRREAIKRQQETQMRSERQTQTNSADLFDIVKGHLMSEGLTEEEALQKMVTMTEEERQSIIEQLDPDSTGGTYDDFQKLHQINDMMKKMSPNQKKKYLDGLPRVGQDGKPFKGV